MSCNIYDLILAIQHFKPETLDFLDSIKNRYTYNTENFLNHIKIDFQKLPIELDGDKKTSFPDTSKFSIEKDWNRLKKIREQAKNLPKQEVIKLEEFNKKETKEFEEKVVDIQNILISNLDQVYKNELWDELTRTWLKLVFEYASEEWKKAVQEFIKEFEINDITFEKYLSIKKPRLGIRVDRSPRLYYNNLRQLMIDIIRQFEALKNRNSFLKEWALAKHKILNSQILYPWIQEVTNSSLESLLEDDQNNLIISEEGSVIQIKMKDYGPSKIDIRLK